MAMAATSVLAGVFPMSVPAAPERGEPDIVDLAVSGDMGAFERIYREYEGRIYGVCLRMTGIPHAAEECTQSTFIRAWENLHRFEKRSALGSWLHRIAVNEVLGRARRNKRQGAHLRMLAESPDHGDRVVRQRDGDGLDIEDAVSQLPEGARHVFVLVAVYGHSHAEAAEQLGIAQGTCKAQLHRARKLLQARLGGDD